MSTSATKNLTAQDYFSTTLSAGITSSTTTIPLNSVPSGSEGFLVIDPDNASKEIIFYNAKSSSDVTVPTTGDRGRGGTSAVSHSSGATVKMMVNSDYVKEMQNGHAMGDAFLTPNHLVASTGTSWAWQSWTPTWSGLTVGNGINSSTYVQIGKTVHFKIKFTLGSTSAVTGSLTPTLPVTSINYVGGAGLGWVTLGAAGGSWPSIIEWASTTTMQLICLNTASTRLSREATSSTVPATWATGDLIVGVGTYEAA